MNCRKLSYYQGIHLQERRSKPHNQNQGSSCKSYALSHSSYEVRPSSHFWK